MLLITIAICLFGNTRDTSVINEKANSVCFIYMQPQKVKSTSVQINMKHASYIRTLYMRNVRNGAHNNLCRSKGKRYMFVMRCLNYF